MPAQPKPKTLVNGDLDMDLPFGSSAEKYLLAGWNPFPISVPKEKYPPESGRTGWQGRDYTLSEIQSMSDRKRKLNVALRMPRGVIGIDVDHYDGVDGNVKGDKRGGDTLAELEKKLGPLPPTVMTTARVGDNELLSGIRLFRVPDETILQGVMGPGIEVIQRHHRFAVCAPSFNPKNGLPYKWWDSVTRAELPGIPNVADLPELPKAWIDYFAAKNKRSIKTAAGGTVPATRMATGGMIDIWMRSNDRFVPCDRMKKVLGDFQKKVDDGNARHDSMLSAQLSLVNLAEVGHQGGAAALETLYQAFMNALAGDREADGEWMDALAGAIGIVTDPNGDPVTYSGCCRPNNLPKLQVPENPSDQPEFFIDQLSSNEALFGVFRRSGGLVWTPTVGNAGYTPPPKGEDDGPAQVQQLDVNGAIGFVNRSVWLYEEQKDSDGRVYETRVFGDAWPITLRLGALDLRIPRLTGVTHTPCLLPDGTVLSKPGYDPVSGYVYMPTDGLNVPPIPSHPDRDQARRAAQYLIDLIDEFPFVSDSDRSNYLAAWLSPIILPLLRTPPPYILLNAPMMGSGKSLLAEIMGKVHGWVLRSTPPTVDEEVRKQITSILTGTTAPVVVWDNLVEPLMSPRLASLVTSSTWSDRVLGATEEASVSSMRLYVATGNNIQLAGDMSRRAIWVTIDPDMPTPWTRHNFRYSNLAAHVEQHRGEILAAMLTICRAWVVAGQPRKAAREDSFKDWFEIMDGILEFADVLGGVGQTVEDKETSRGEDDELAKFLHALHDEFGSNKFMGKDAALKLVGGAGVNGGFSDLGLELPEDLHDKLRTCLMTPGTMIKPLGKYLSRNAGRWAGGFSVVKVGEQRRSAVWQVKQKLPPAHVQTSLIGDETLEDLIAEGSVRVDGQKSKPPGDPKNWIDVDLS